MQTDLLTRRERNRLGLRLDSIARSTAELLEIFELRHLIIPFERLGISMHLAAEIKESKTLP